MNLNEEYWSDRYKEHLTGWDVGYATPPITSYFSKLQDRTTRILIPGAGNAHEAAFLHTEGFANVSVCDFAPEPLQRFAALYPTFPKDRLLCQNFFSLEGSFDIIVEQTFFCALDPELRTEYVRKQNELLSSGGLLVGVLFNRTFDREGPPFGGEISEYRRLFSPFFHINIMETCHNSIASRLGSEHFIELQKL